MFTPFAFRRIVSKDKEGYLPAMLTKHSRKFSKPPGLEASVISLLRGRLGGMFSETA